MIAYLLLVVLAQWIAIFAMYSAIVYTLLKDLLRIRVTILATIAIELKPFYWPSSALWLFWAYGNTSLFNKIMITAGIIAGWVIIKNIDDDRWKKRRKKLKEKVSQIHGRLVVTPA